MPKKNDSLQWLEKLRVRAKELHAEEAAAIDTIRSGFVERAIVFMDVVGSTAFKVQHSTTPEQWILRVQQFSELLASAVHNCNGQVVKFIGDEVMATFKNVNDAQNLVARVSEIEDNLKSATGFETRIKVAVDLGPVYELTFTGHDAPDPQGSAVDRCARLAKFGLPGEVISSATFAEKTPQLNWKKVGVAELKGLGRQVVYQLGRATADIEPRVEVQKKDYDAITEERDELKTENARLKEQNKQLQQQLHDVGERPAPDASIEEDDNDAWDKVQQEIQTLKKVIEGAPGPSYKYARFAFLYFGSKGYEQYNKYEDRTFDELAEANLVTEVEGGYYRLNPEHPRNKRLLKILEDVEAAVATYVDRHGADPEDLFEWTMKDAAFWETYVGWKVV